MKVYQFKFIPKVTTSREEFIKHIDIVCTAFGVPIKYEREWLARVNDISSHGNYFYGMIFVVKLSPYVIVHELIHHIANTLRYFTLSEFWYKLDYWNDLVNLIKKYLEIFYEKIREH